MHDFQEFSVSNYLKHAVSIKSAEKSLANLFNELLAKNFTNILIKIDVEGMERAILDAIITQKPNALEIAVIFENWDQTSSVALNFYEEISNRFALYYLDQPKSLLAKFASLIGLGGLKGCHSRLSHYRGPDHGTYILVL